MADDNKTIQAKAAEPGLHEGTNNDEARSSIGVYDRPERKISPLAIAFVILLILALLVVFLVFSNVL